MATVPYGDPGPAAAASDWTETQKLHIATVQQAREEIGRLNVHSASLINMHTWRLHAQGSVHRDRTIDPAPALTDEGVVKLVHDTGRHLTFSQGTFLQPYIDFGPTEGNDIKAKAIIPLELALDFMYQHHGQFNKEGGIFCIDTAEPLEFILQNKGKDSKGREINGYAEVVLGQYTIGGVAIPVLEALNIAHRQQIEYYERMFNEAEDFYMHQNRAERKKISKRHRAIAIAMKGWSMIAGDPPWLTVSRMDAKPNITCPACQNEAKSGAVKCITPNCNYVFDPYQAVKLGVLDENSPGYLSAVRRMSREQLDELEIEAEPLEETETPRKGKGKNRS